MTTPDHSDPQRRQISDIYRRMESIESRIWWGPVLRGLIALVLGVVVFTLNTGDENQAVKLACIWIGVFAIANGVVSLLTAFLDRSAGPRGLPAAIGLVSLVLGLLLVIWPVAMAAIAIILLGVALLAMGGMQVYTGVQLRRADPDRRFNGLLAFGIVLLALGVVTVLLPVFVAKVFIFVAALILVLVGVVFIAIGFSIRAALRP